MKKILYTMICMGLFPWAAIAGQVEVRYAKISIHGDTLRASVTLKHADEGWKHYADAWRIVDEQGKQLGIRILYHPHVEEQPFTRSQSGISLPPGIRVIYVEGRDTVHGWSKDRIRVDLDKMQGDRFEVRKR